MLKINILLSFLFLISCSKNEKQIIYQESETNKEDKSSAKLSEEVSELERLLVSSSPNIALTNLLAKSLSSEHKKQVKAVVDNLSSEQINFIIESLKSEARKIKEHYLFKTQRYQDNFMIRESYARLIQLNGENSFSYEDQLRFSSIAYLKSSYLNSIIKSYTNRSQKLLDGLADQAIFLMGQDPQTVQSVESSIKNDSKERAIETIRSNKKYIEIIDSHFKTSNLNENEQYLLVSSGMIAGAVYLKLKDDKGFKHFLKEAEIVIKDIKQIVHDIKEFKALTAILQDHIKNSEEEVSKLKVSLSQTGKDLEAFYNEARNGLTASSNVKSRSIVTFLHETLEGKKSSPKSDNPSILSKQIRINENFTQSIDSAAKLAGNLSAILETSEKFAKLFKVKLSQDVQETLAKVQQASAIIQTAQTTMQGFQSGGILGGIAALGTSQAVQMMGAGDPTKASLELIHRKLDQVLKNQVEIIKTQVETMGMIKQLALMVDEQHQQQIAALAEIRDLSLLNLEISKAQLNTNIRSCERMVNYQLSSIWSNFDFSRSSFYSINQIGLIKKDFSSSIRDLNDISRIVRSVEENGFERCQNAIAEAFGGNYYLENPLLTIYSSSENENLYRFNREVYQPQKRLLNYYVAGGDIDTIPLHLPSIDYVNQSNKIPYLDYAHTTPDLESNNYFLESLISAKNLERYLSHLLILYPILDLDKAVWSKDYQTIVKDYLSQANSTSNHNTRSHYFLSNALKLVQSAIAQEALLAGEPFIHKLYQNFMSKIIEDKPCDQVEANDFPQISQEPFICVIRNNKLLMKNLVRYGFMLKKKHHHLSNEDFITLYASSAKEANQLKTFIHPSLEENLITLADGQLAIKLPLKEGHSTLINLPNQDELKHLYFLYSENMSRLLSMQTVVLKELSKVTPFTSQPNKRALLSLILSSNLSMNI